MKFYKLTEEQLKDEPTCRYELWDKDMKKMVPCGEPAVFSSGAFCANPLCETHGRFVGALNSQNTDVPRDELFGRPEPTLFDPQKAS